MIRVDQRSRIAPQAQQWVLMGSGAAAPAG